MKNACPKKTATYNQVTGIDKITLVARDLGKARRIMDAALGAQAETVHDAALNASGIVYQVGPHRLEYLTPADDSSPLRQHIAFNAPVPWRVRFKTEGAARTIAPADAAGVRLELQSD